MNETFESAITFLFSLKILGVRENQFGMYKCEATNIYGSANQTVELYESKIPICPPVCGDIDLANAGSGTIQKAWVAIATSIVFSMVLAR